MRVHASEGEERIASVREDELQLPCPQPGCAFYTGQLVHATGKDGGTTLCRVVAFERVGYKLGYKVHIVRL